MELGKSEALSMLHHHDRGFSGEHLPVHEPDLEPPERPLGQAIPILDRRPQVAPLLLPHDRIDDDGAAPFLHLVTNKLMDSRSFRRGA
jgi:hypothetical protein